MSEERSLQEIQKDWPQTLKIYLIGFAGSILLTVVSFALAIAMPFSMKPLIGALIFLAILQAFVQLVCFMHFGKESKPHWMTLVFYFMVLVVLIVALGSIWIIMDLDHRVMPMHNMSM